MRSSLAIGLLLSLVTSACVSVNGDDDDDNDRVDSGTVADSGVDSGVVVSDSGVVDRDSGVVSDRDSGVVVSDSGVVVDSDSGVSDSGFAPIECDPDFGAADACGGALAGTWTYRAACGTTPVVTLIQAQCPAVTIRADRYEGGSGSLEVSGASFDLDVTVDVHVEATIPASCAIAGCAATQAVLQNAINGSTVSCSSAGTGCDCTIDGPVNTETIGTVTTSGGVATVDGAETYYYCVSGDSLIYRRFDGAALETVYVLDR